MYLELNDLTKLGVNLTGVLHIGMHQAEEYDFYKQLGISNMFFVEANRMLCDMVANTHIGQDPSVKILNAAIFSVSGLDVELNVTNNYQSSSLLQLKEHRNIYPHIINVDTIKVKTHTLDECMNMCEDPSVYNFLVLDIQGVELEAMKGLTDWDNIDLVYTEVNYKEMYDKCALEPQVTEFLKEKGFEKIQEIDTGAGWGDALYIKK